MVHVKLRSKVKKVSTRASMKVVFVLITFLAERPSTSVRERAVDIETSITGYSFVLSMD